MAKVQAASKGLSSQYVTFLLGNETYGISILKLNEIIAYQECTTIPNVPGFIKGVLNLQGYRCSGNRLKGTV